MAIAFDSELVYYSEAARDAKCPNDSMKHCRQPLVEIFIPDDDWLNLIEWLEISANAYHDAVADRTKNSVIESYVRHLSGEEFEENTMTQLVLTGRENE
jgi:hypothetical protein